MHHRHDAVNLPIELLRTFVAIEDLGTVTKAAEALISKARESGKAVRVERFPVGHHQMLETPDLTLFAMRDFLRS